MPVHSQETSFESRIFSVLVLFYDMVAAFQALLASPVTLSQITFLQHDRSVIDSTARYEGRKKRTFFVAENQILPV